MSGPAVASDGCVKRSPADHRAARIVALADGRRLAYAEYGDPDGAPLFAFHGTPGSRLMLSLADGPARSLRLRLIAPDRPGFGRSDFQPGRTFAHWPDDVCALADALGIDRFGVAGISGGAPYAMACAWKVPHRLRSIGIVSGVGPLVGPNATADLSRGHRLLFGLAARSPRLARHLMEAVRLGWQRFPDRLFTRLVAWAPPQDRAIITRPEVRACLIKALLDAFRCGGRGVAQELVLFGSPWGFPLEEIRLPVHLWHGEADALVPPAMGRHIAASVPRCIAVFVPDAGHYWVFDHIEGLLRAIGRSDH
jgi:pimeloyl-ACP methyl ester carboxylesterase